MRSFGSGQDDKDLQNYGRVLRLGEAWVFRVLRGHGVDADGSLMRGVLILGSVESKSRDLGSDRGYRVAVQKLLDQSGGANG
jgi:hypothetical protein